MKLMAMSMALALAGISATAAAIPVAKTFDTRAFAVDAIWQSHEWGAQLIGETERAASFSLPLSALNFTTDGHLTQYDAADLRFHIQTKPGYRVTGFALTGMLVGEVRRGNHVATAGNGGGLNRASAYVQASTFQPTTDYMGAELQAAYLNGSQAFSLVATGRPVPDSFYLNVMASAYVREVPWGEIYCGGQGGCGEGRYAYASMAYKDLVLTINTAPVPEPETYAMLLGGLALTGFLARRRQRKAQ